MPSPRPSVPHESSVPQDLLVTPPHLHSPPCSSVPPRPSTSSRLGSPAAGRAGGVAGITCYGEPTPPLPSGPARSEASTGPGRMGCGRLESSRGRRGPGLGARRVQDERNGAPGGFVRRCRSSRSGRRGGLGVRITERRTWNTGGSPTALPASTRTQSTSAPAGAPGQRCGRAEGGWAQRDTCLRVERRHAPRSRRL